MVFLHPRYKACKVHINSLKSSYYIEFVFISIPILSHSYITFIYVFPIFTFIFWMGKFILELVYSIHSIITFFTVPFIIKITLFLTLLTIQRLASIISNACFVLRFWISSFSVCLFLLNVSLASKVFFKKSKSICLLAFLIFKSIFGFSFTSLMKLR